MKHNVTSGNWCRTGIIKSTIKTAPAIAKAVSPAGGNSLSDQIAHYLKTNVFERGVTLKLVAEKFGVSPGYVSKIKRRLG
jgi:AraC-like DNA-binding protein